MSEQTTKFTTLDGFTIERILKDDPLTKVVAVLGRFEGRDGQAIVFLARQHFATEQLQQLCSAQTKLQTQFENDIYHKYEGDAMPALTRLNVDIVYPCTEKHIAKYSEQRYVMVTETPQLYNTVVLPFLRDIPASRTQWVKNILAKEAEAERLIFEDPDPALGFVLHPDMKWDGLHKDSLYCIAIVKRGDLKSLRDLTAEHIPLLLNVLQKTQAAIQERYSVSPQHLRAYIHYQPSYYHLHIHFNHTAVVAGSMSVGRAHLLEDVIDNLTISSDYYRRRVLVYAVGEDDALLGTIERKQQELQTAAVIS